MRHLPELLSLPQVIDTIDLYTVQETFCHRETSFDVLLSGTATAIYMQSFVQVSSHSTFTGTDSLMPPTVCALQQQKELIAQQRVSLSVEFSYGSSLSAARCRLL